MRDAGIEPHVEDVAFALHAGGEPFHPAEPRQLQSEFALQLAIDALREPDGSLAAPTDQLDDAIRADLIARLELERLHHRIRQPNRKAVSPFGNW